MTTIITAETIKEALNENNVHFNISFINSLYVAYTDGYLTLGEIMEQAAMDANLSEDKIERFYDAGNEVEAPRLAAAREELARLMSTDTVIPF